MRRLRPRGGHPRPRSPGERVEAPRPVGRSGPSPGFSSGGPARRPRAPGNGRKRLAGRDKPSVGPAGPEGHTGYSVISTGGSRVKRAALGAPAAGTHGASSWPAGRRDGRDTPENRTVRPGRGQGTARNRLPLGVSGWASPDLGEGGPHSGGGETRVQLSGETAPTSEGGCAGRGEEGSLDGLGWRELASFL